jgi:hypothetical protein
MDNKETKFFDISSKEHVESIDYYDYKDKSSFEELSDNMNNLLKELSRVLKLEEIVHWINRRLNK